MQIQIGDVTSHYQLIGTTSTKKPTLVLLHGWGCDWQIWSPVIFELSKSYQLIIPDLPAFGQSSTPHEVWDSQTYADWLEKLLQKIIPSQKCILVGHSFGGKIAAIYASAHPAQVKNLILTAASGLPSPLTNQQKLQQRLAAMIPSSLKHAIPAALREKVLHTMGAATDHFHSTPPQQAILKKIVRENISQHLTKITAPTLLLWGDQDQDTPLSQGKEFARYINGSDLVVLPNTGHFAFIDQPKKFIEEMCAFIDRS